MRVLVCGAGVIGAAIAYFLTRRNIDVTVIERTGVACAASGKSGGFLALDWCDGSALGPLARRSFALHATLADEIDADYGYRRMDTYSGFMGSGDPAAAGGHHALPWISDALNLNRQLGNTETTGQLDPERFTRALLEAAVAAGAELVEGAVTGLVRSNDEMRVTGVSVGDEAIVGDAVVVAMGPWSILASAWMPIPPVFGLKGHSVVYDTQKPLPADALFVDVREASGASASPEVFPRPDGTTYVCGVSSEEPLPVDPAEVAPDPGAIERLEAMCADLSRALGADRIIQRQSCFRPVTQDGLPLIGAVAGLSGAHIATGHSVWGMLNAPATGEAMAELIVDGAATTIDLSPFDPGRMPPFDAANLRSTPD